MPLDETPRQKNAASTSEKALCAIFVKSRKSACVISFSLV